MRAPADIDAIECNCTVCTKKGRFPRLVVPAHCVDFESGIDALTIYTFGTGTAKHMFCSTCGALAVRLSCRCRCLLVCVSVCLSQVYTP